MKGKLQILRSHWFIISLFILLLNDFFFKETFHNWLTGKLSDFAGLFVFALFWTAIFPHYKKVIFGVTATLFILWKSSWSQPFIDSWNAFGLLPIDRVVDLSDLLALSVLPLAYFVEQRSSQVKTVRLTPVIPILLSAFAFGATSYSTNEKLNKNYTVNVTKDSIINRLSRLDSVTLNNTPTPTSDTFELSINNELCHDRISAKITVVEIDDSTSVVTFLNATHPCPKKDVQEKDIIASFENNIINPLQGNVK